MAYIKYIQDEAHYSEVIEKISSVKKSLWIGTSDIKDLHVKAGNSSEPLLGVWAGFKCKDCSRKKFCGDPIV